VLHRVPTMKKVSALLCEQPFSSQRRLLTQALHWDRGRPARNEHRKVRDLGKCSLQTFRFALRAHGGRAARGPSEELESNAKVSTKGAQPRSPDAEVA
jgi:hypothetical protein